jgi:hypothetical protein
MNFEIGIDPNQPRNIFLQFYFSLNQVSIKFIKLAFSFFINNLKYSQQIIELKFNNLIRKLYSLQAKFNELFNGKSQISIFVLSPSLQSISQPNIFFNSSTNHDHNQQNILSPQ